MTDMLTVRWGYVDRRRMDTPSLELLSLDGAVAMIMPNIPQPLCDFCGKPHRTSVVPQILGMRAKMDIPSLDQVIWMDGPFAACTACQSVMGIKHGDREVEFAPVRKRFLEETHRLWSIQLESPVALSRPFTEHFSTPRPFSPRVVTAWPLPAQAGLPLPSGTMRPQPLRTTAALLAEALGVRSLRWRCRPAPP